MLPPRSSSDSQRPNPGPSSDYAEHVRRLAELAWRTGDPAADAPHQRQSRENRQRVLAAVWMANRHAAGADWLSVRDLASYLFAADPAFWGAPKATDRVTLRELLTHTDSRGVFELRRNRDAATARPNDMVRLCEGALVASFAAAQSDPDAVAASAEGLLRPQYMCLRPAAGPAAAPAAPAAAAAAAAAAQRSAARSGSIAGPAAAAAAAGAAGEALRRRAGGTPGAVRGKSSPDFADGGEAEADGDERELGGSVSVEFVRALCDELWPPAHDDPHLSAARALRRGAAAWLFSCGAVRRRGALPLSTLRRHLEEAAQLHHAWDGAGPDPGQARARALRSLAPLLTAPDSRGTFRLAPVGPNDVEAVFLHLDSMRAATSGGGGIGGGIDGAAAAGGSIAVVAGGRSPAQPPQVRALGLGGRASPASAGGADSGMGGCGGRSEPDWWHLESATKLACDQSLRGRVWRLAAAVLAPLSGGPCGCRSMGLVGAGERPGRGGAAP
ncbi:hypothetical protein GPECTOR_142g703 [Gonium pectorale]|uniref:Uncharacterized protein n=1 Tax=Gonium pectorale TaxID=33097 RepID=A0A150FXY6_GONPE|nr:hypothetical protein GPECTOR_142g703 [Gonium pectorale]|eukprot:KXZ42482.1 hypothetical protein GPECTOR_142g703 [Gonium pectorale]